MEPASYSRTQIVLHWVIAILVFFQILVHEGIVRAWAGRMDGTLPNEPTPNPHAIVGVLILILILWRLALRRQRGVPGLPEGEHPVLKTLATGTHWLFYIVLIAMALSGVAAWLLGSEAMATVHSAARLVLIPLILLHVLAALAQRFWFRTDVLRRMLGPT